MLLTFILQAYLHALLEVNSASVEWSLSNAWQDSSCTSVCSDLGMSCTEKCWPADADGLNELIRLAPALTGVCFGVQAGDSSPWHPAKDPENTLCYWNAGAVSGPRCTVVPKTPATSAAKNKLIRRFCPCYNASMPVDDCSMGSARVAPEWTQASSTGAASGGTQQQQTSRTSGAGGCGQLCISGFQGLDADLNGEYDYKNSLWTRQGDRFGIEIGKVNGYWRFSHVTAGGGKILVAESKNYARSTDVLPPGDTYTSARSSYEMTSQCCGSATNVGTATVGKDSGLSTTALLVVGVVLFSVAALLLTALYLRRQAAKNKAAAQQQATKVSQNPSQYPMDSNLSAARMADVQSPSHGTNADRAARAVDAQTCWPHNTLRKQDPEDQPLYLDHSPVMESWEVPCNNRQSPTNRPSPAPHRPRDIGVARKGELYSGTPLVRQKIVVHQDPLCPPPIQSRWNRDIPLHGSRMDYEPPLQASFGGATYDGAVMELTPAHLQEGHPVRIVGLENEPTWEGAEGIVESYNDRDGFVRIEFRDGRTKTVPEGNVESTLGRHHQQPQQTSTPTARAERGGRGGIKARPQNSKPPAKQQQQQ